MSLLGVLCSSVPLILSLPAHASHSPGYILGAFAMKKLGGDEEEARAQFGAIIGGAGVGLGTAATSWYGLKMIKTVVRSGLIGEWTRRLGVWNLLEETVSPSIWEYGRKAIESITRSWFELGRLGNVFCVFGLAWALCRWHNRVIDGK